MRKKTTYLLRNVTQWRSLGFDADGYNLIVLFLGSIEKRMFFVFYIL